MNSLAADPRLTEQEAKPKLTAEALLRRRAAQFPEALALADPPDREGLGAGRSLRYREADQAVDALASLFIELGLKPGDRIAIQLPNLVEQPLTIISAWRAGLTVCALPMLWRRMEIAKIAAELKPRALVGVSAFAGESPLQSLCQIAAQEMSVRFVLGFGTDVPDGVTPLDDALQTQGDGRLFPVEARQVEGAALITFTARRGAALLPVFHAEQDLLAQGAMTVLALSLNRRDVILNPYPLTGPAGLGLGLMPWLISGGALLQHQPFDQKVFVQQLLEGGATVTALPPAMLAAFESDGVWHDPRCKLRQLGRVWSAAQLAEARPEPDEAQTFDLYPIGDLASLVRLRDPNSDPALLPRGKVFLQGEDGDGALFLETMLGDSCGDGQADELKLRGPICPRGSAGGPLAPDSQGFVSSGLCARWAGEPKDLLRITRDRELLSHGGLSIAAAELDGIYQSFSGFLDAACFVRPDPVMGDRIFAAVVPKAGRLISLESLHRFLRHQGVAPYKYPDRLVMVNAIPRDAAGRVLRDQLPQEA